jgi:Tol biopolymer transport system component
MRVDVSVIDFSPDSKQFVYLDIREPQNAKVGSLESDGFTSLTKNESPNVIYNSPKFSPDGSRIALVSVEDFAEGYDKAVRRLHIFEGGAGRPVFTTNQAARMIGWSFDGDVILATSSQLIPVSPATVDILAVAPSGVSRKLFSLDDTFIRSTAISADGKTLAFVANRNARDDIWTVALSSGAEPKQNTFSGSSRVFFANLMFSPDGRIIYFDKQEEVNVISMLENFN